MVQWFPMTLPVLPIPNGTKPAPILYRHVYTGIIVSTDILTTVFRQDPGFSFAVHPVIPNSIGSDPRCDRNVKAAWGSDLNRTSVATDLSVKSVGGCDSAEMRRPAIRSTAHSPIPLPSTNSPTPLYLRHKTPPTCTLTHWWFSMWGAQPRHPTDGSPPLTHQPINLHLPTP